MNISIKSTQQDSTGGTRALIEEKFAVLERLTSRAVSPASLACEIEQSIAIERAGAKYRVEGNLTVDGKLFRAEAEGATLEEAVDKVRDGLVREVTQSRGRTRELVKRGGAAIKRMLRLAQD